MYFSCRSSVLAELDKHHFRITQSFTGWQSPSIQLPLAHQERKLHQVTLISITTSIFKQRLEVIKRHNLERGQKLSVGVLSNFFFFYHISISVDAIRVGSRIQDRVNLKRYNSKLLKSPAQKLNRSDLIGKRTSWHKSLSDAKGI